MTGARYEGEFRNGKRSGFGRRTFDNGSSVWYSGMNEWLRLQSSRLSRASLSHLSVSIVAHGCAGQWQNGHWNGCGRANHPMLEERDREGYFRDFRHVEARDCAAEVALAEQYAGQVRKSPCRLAAPARLQHSSEFDK